MVSGSSRGQRVHGRDQRGQQVVARNLAAGVDAQRGGDGGQIGWKRGLVEIDADAGDGLVAGDLYQDARDFAAVEHQIVGPADIAADARDLLDGFDGGQAQGEGQHGIGLQDHRTVQAGAGGGMPPVAVAALAGGLLVGKHHIADVEIGGRPHGGVDGSEVEHPAAHAHSSRKLISMARAECVMAPAETKSAPVSA